MSADSRQYLNELINDETSAIPVANINIWTFGGLPPQKNSL